MWFGPERGEAAITQLKVCFIKPGGEHEMTAFIKCYSVHLEKGNVNVQLFNHNIRGIQNDMVIMKNFCSIKSNSKIHHLVKN